MSLLVYSNSTIDCVKRLIPEMCVSSGTLNSTRYFVNLILINVFPLIWAELIFPLLPLSPSITHCFPLQTFPEILPTIHSIPPIWLPSWTQDCSQFSFVFSVTVKPVSLVFPLFREFCNLDDFAKITGRKYSKSYAILVYCLIQQAKSPKLMAPK